MKIVTSKKRDISLVVIMLIWIAVMLFSVIYTVTTTVGATERKLPVYSVEADERKLALTFNCAWGTEGLDEILEILSRENIRCTFFFVGEFAQKYPEAVRKIYNAGHETGNHSMHHTDPVKLEYEEILSDINACNELLFSITGVTPSLYRAPSGSYDNKTVEAAQSLGMTAIQWDVDSIDWKDISYDSLAGRVVSKSSPGSIVLFHIGKENTVRAFDRIIKELKGNGYSFSTVGELLLQGETYIDHTGRQFRKIN